MTKKPSFSPYFITQFLGAFNDNVFKNAIVILFTFQSVSVFGISSTGLVAMAGGIFILPYFLFSACFGEISERNPKNRVIKWAKFLEILIMIAGSYTLISKQYELTLLTLFLMGTQSTLYGPVKYGILQELTLGEGKTFEENLTKNTSLVTGSSFVAILTGTILGGYLGNADYLDILAIVLVSISLIGFLASLFVNQSNSKFVQNGFLKKEKQEYETINVITSTIQILKEVKNKPEVWKLLVGISWFWLFGASLLSFIPTLANEYLHGDENVATLFLAIFTLFMGIGSLLTEKFTFKNFTLGIPAPYLMVLGIVTSIFGVLLYFSSVHYFVSDPIGILEFWALDNSFLIIALLAAISFLGGPYVVSQMTILQLKSPKKSVSKYIGANNILNALFMVVSSIAIIVLSGLGLAIPDLFLILGILSSIFSIIVYRWYMLDSIALSIKTITSIFYRPEIEGEQNFPKNGPYIVLSNHLSFVDWLFIMRISPTPVKFIIDRNYYEPPLIKFWMTQAELIPIATRRDNEEVYKKAFEGIERELNKNSTLGIFPEGTITHTGEMRRFQPGINKILSMRSIPVVPVTLHDLYGSIFARSGNGVLKKLPGGLRPRIRVTIHPSISGSDFDLKKCEELMRDCYEKGRKN